MRLGRRACAGGEGATGSTCPAAQSQGLRGTRGPYGLPPYTRLLLWERGGGHANRGLGVSWALGEVELLRLPAVAKRLWSRVLRDALQKKREFQQSGGGTVSRFDLQWPALSGGIFYVLFFWGVPPCGVLVPGHHLGRGVETARNHPGYFIFLFRGVCTWPPSETSLWHAGI
ncbi:MAG: hypothetical protein JWR26_218 [Pedosphaera sp.]|nr:hypothetical protein [Pedosphaera sp.]